MAVESSNLPPENDLYDTAIDFHYFNLYTSTTTPIIQKVDVITTYMVHIHRVITLLQKLGESGGTSSK